MNKNMNNNITLDHRNSKMTFPNFYSTSKSAFIFAMLHSFSWLVLYAVLTKNTYTDKLRNIAFIIKCDSSAIMNVILRSLSVIYSSVLNAAPSESRWWRSQTRLYWRDAHDNHMPLSCSPNFFVCLLITKYKVDEEN